MENKQQKTLAIAGAGIVAAAALGITGATLASAASETGTPSSAVASGSTQPPGSSGTTTTPGQGRGMRAAGGTLTADAASKAVAAATAEVDGGTVHGVRALSDGTYRVDVSTGDGTRVRVLLDRAFAVTSVERGTGRGGGGRGMPDGDGGADAPSGGTLPGGGSTGSTDPSDANGTSTKSPTT